MHDFFFSFGLFHLKPPCFSLGGEVFLQMYEESLRKYYHTNGLIAGLLSYAFMLMCMPNNTVHVADVTIACYSMLESIYKKHAFLTSKRKTAAFPVYLVSGLINSCKIAGYSPNLPCQQHRWVNVQVPECSLELCHLFNCNKGWAVLFN